MGSYLWPLPLQPARVCCELRRRFPWGSRGCSLAVYHTHEVKLIDPQIPGDLFRGTGGSRAAPAPPLQPRSAGWHRSAAPGLGRPQGLGAPRPFVGRQSGLTQRVKSLQNTVPKGSAPCASVSFCCAHSAFSGSPQPVCSPAGRW